MSIHLALNIQHSSSQTDWLVSIIGPVTWACIKTVSAHKHGCVCAWGFWPDMPATFSKTNQP